MAGEASSRAIRWAAWAIDAVCGAGDGRTAVAGGFWLPVALTIHQSIYLPTNLAARNRLYLRHTDYATDLQLLWLHQPNLSADGYNRACGFYFKEINITQKNPKLKPSG